MRTIIYVDGFNLYYGALKNSDYKWLDLVSLFRSLLRPENEIVKIKYFTSRVKPHPHNPSKPERQMAYLRALREYRPAGYPDIDIIYGHFSSKKIQAQIAPPLSGKLEIKNIPEEKCSDVSLAVHMLNDCWLDAYDCAVLVSNDSDFKGALELVKHHGTMEDHGEKVIGLFTPGGYVTSDDLKEWADFTHLIRKGALQNNQLPVQIPGTNITKPSGW